MRSRHGSRRRLSYKTAWLLGLSLVIAPALALGCGEERRTPPPGYVDENSTCAYGGTTIDVADEEPPEVACDRIGVNVRCIGNWAVLCDARNRVVKRENCRADGLACFERPCTSVDDCEGCLPCNPRHVRCGDDGERERCAEDGSGYEPETPCDEAAGLRCDSISSQCLDLCAEAEAKRSYIGCEYYAVATSNAQLDFLDFDRHGNCQPFSFAVVVANGTDVVAHVTVETAQGARIERTVRPTETETIDLPCSLELTGQIDPNDVEGTLRERFSSVGVRAAHRITSDVPVTVYQFNPLEYESKIGDREIYSYTNDASLLLPVSALTGHYMAVTVPTLLHERTIPNQEEPARLSGPGFIALVGVSDEPAEVQITSTAHTLPSKDGTLPALEPGDTITITLARGEVAQILSAAPEDCAGDEVDARRKYCKVPRDYDLSGTRVRSSQPVMMLAGHDCAFVPYNRWACDHLEEAMQPIDTWGQDIVVSLSDQADCFDPLPNMIRVVASSDGTRVRFEPEIHPPITLDEGEVFETEITSDVRVRASDGVAVAQLLLGEDYLGLDQSSSFTKGDPSLALAVPTEQWRDRYSVLSPSTFTDNFIGIIARDAQTVVIDGRVVTQYRALEGTGFKVAQVPVAGGQHTLESALPFGVTVYGYARYCSYMVAGGLDLKLINPPD